MPLSYFHGPYNRHKEHKVALFDTTNSQLQAHHYVRINNHIGIGKEEEGSWWQWLEVCTASTDTAGEK